MQNSVRENREYFMFTLTIKTKASNLNQNLFINRMVKIKKRERGDPPPRGSFQRKINAHLHQNSQAKKTQLKSLDFDQDLDISKSVSSSFTLENDEVHQKNNPPQTSCYQLFHDDPDEDKLCMKKSHSAQKKVKLPLKTKESQKQIESNLKLDADFEIWFDKTINSNGGQVKDQTQKKGFMNTNQKMSQENHQQQTRTQINIASESIKILSADKMILAGITSEEKAQATKNSKRIFAILLCKTFDLEEGSKSLPNKEKENPQPNKIHGVLVKAAQIATHAKMFTILRMKESYFQFLDAYVKEQDELLESQKKSLDLTSLEPSAPRQIKIKNQKALSDYRIGIYRNNYIKSLLMSYKRAYSLFCEVKIDEAVEMIYGVDENSSAKKLTKAKKAKTEIWQTINKHSHYREKREIVIKKLQGERYQQKQNSD